MLSSPSGKLTSPPFQPQSLHLALSQLATTFGNNIIDDTSAFKKLITKKEDTEGIPANTLTRAAQEAKSAGHADATAEKGPWLFNLDAPTYV